MLQLRCRDLKRGIERDKYGSFVADIEANPEGHFESVLTLKIRRARRFAVELWLILFGLSKWRKARLGDA